MSSLEQELLSILEHKKLTPHFQPIISLHQKKIVGYEALIRGPSNSPFNTPFHLFDVAERYSLSSQLEFICRELSIQRYAEFNLEAKLFLNISPNVLLDPQFKSGETLRYLDKFGLNPHKVVIELTEHKPTDNYELMREAVMHYRGMGFEIALDDLGAGYSSLRLWSELLPEYVKIDKHFVQELQNDNIKLNFVRSIQAIASSLNCNVIAEGIETEEEFKIIHNLGISHGQGYLFARPNAQPLERIDSSIFCQEKKSEKETLYLHSIAIGMISEFVNPISANTSISDVMNIFQSKTELTVLPLVDDEIASGIIFRDDFLSKLFSSRYGMELFGRKPIKTFIDQIPFSVEHNIPIEKVSEHLTSSMRHEQAFIVTNNKKYVGVATILSLLEKITNQQIDNAKHANPLTLLPGSVPMNAQINQLLATKTPFCLGYFDLDNFKPFNDVYGYSAGDDIIKAVATVLRDHVTTENGIIGHIGGDDFIVIFTSANWLEICQDILNAFEKVVPTYYNPTDVKAGGILTENRANERCFFPMTSLSVGLVPPEITIDCHSHVDVADFASEAKKHAKKMTGNSYFVNQRHSPKMVESIRFNHFQPVLKQLLPLNN